MAGAQRGLRLDGSGHVARNAFERDRLRRRINNLKFRRQPLAPKRSRHLQIARAITNLIHTNK